PRLLEDPLLLAPAPQTHRFTHIVGRQPALSSRGRPNAHPRPIAAVRRRKTSCVATGHRWENGRAGEIRTLDLLHPMQARYQATLRPEQENGQLDPRAGLKQEQIAQVCPSQPRAVQCSRPKYIILRCSLFQRASGNSAFRSRSVSTTLRPRVSRQRLASRWMWVSTGNAGTPKACAMTTLAVLCPTPGSSSSSANVRGTAPPWRPAMILDRPEIAVAF